MATAINDLTKDDIGELLRLANERKLIFVRLTHETPRDKLYMEELAKWRRINEILHVAYQQKP